MALVPVLAVLDEKGCLGVGVFRLPPVAVAGCGGACRQASSISSCWSESCESFLVAEASV